MQKNKFCRPTYPIFFRTVTGNKQFLFFRPNAKLAYVLEWTFWNFSFISPFFRLQDEKCLIMTPFEKNLDFWRQLWRVIERRWVDRNYLTPMLLVANLAITKWCKKKLKNDWNPGTWVLIWEYSERVIQWIPSWQGLDGFKKLLCLVLWTKAVSALEGLTHTYLTHSCFKISHTYVVWTCDTFENNFETKHKCRHEWVNPSMLNSKSKSRLEFCW